MKWLWILAAAGVLAAILIPLWLPEIIALWQRYVGGNDHGQI